MRTASVYAFGSERCVPAFFFNTGKAEKKDSSCGATASPQFLSLPTPTPQHRLLIFKSTAIAWCGFKSWGAILPDDDSADVNGILIVPSATSETSPQRLLLFTGPGLSAKCGLDFSKAGLLNTPASQLWALQGSLRGLRLVGSDSVL